MLTLQIVPYAEIVDLSSVGRIRKLLTIAKQNKIVLLQGRLKKEEEAELIKTTMEEINKDFKGIELAVIEDASSKTASGVEALRAGLSNLFLGDRQGLTIIGPANIVKAIKKDPKKIELYTQDTKKKRKKR
tara:strand:- start:3208 stop:3600 length:393 start_codon:yes stop_codon:yes gene_type:complete